MIEQPIRFRALLEILGKPKEHVESKIKEYLGKIKEDSSTMLLSEKILPPQEHNELWGVVAEIEIVVKGITSLVNFCIDYMPSSIEIIKPESFKFQERTFTEFINDMLAKLHTVDMIAKKLGTENSILKDNMNRMINNHLLVSIKLGIDDAETLSRSSGIESSEIEKFLGILVKEGKLKKEEGRYIIGKNEGTKKEH